MSESRLGGGPPIRYRDAGVDRDLANRAKQRIAEWVESTRTGGVVSRPGGFGGLFRVPGGMAQPLLAASADGVGTKLKVAMLTGRHDTVGEDLVNHCVNDILVEGAHPLFFLDYIGMGRLDSSIVEQLVAGVARGCQHNECALLGGETAEMPDFYAPGEYDLAGFIVGVVEEEHRPGAHRVEAGDVLVGLASNGFHTNGYSLLRHLLFEVASLTVDDPYPDMESSVGDVLLRTHMSYAGALLPLLGEGRIHALAHITGGGLPDNLARVIPPGKSGEIDLDSWRVPPEFEAIRELARLDDAEMFRTFNMGVGMVVVAPPSEAATVLARLEAAGHHAWHVGKVVDGGARVELRHR